MENQFPPETALEKRIVALMHQHDSAEPMTLAIGNGLRRIVDSFRLVGVHEEVVAYTVLQHAAALLSADKIMRRVRPELAELLAQDVVETLNRAIPGQPRLASEH